MVSYDRRAKALIILTNDNHKFTKTKYLGDNMTIGDIAVVRTGLATARKKKSSTSLQTYEYKLLNLKCITEEGRIDQSNIESFELSEELKADYLTRMGDILIRLSAPYTAVLIDRQDMCGIVVPSHFAILRVDNRYVTPEYVFWSLRRDKNRIRMMQNSSGSTAFGTISSGLISSLPITLLSLHEQQAIGDLLRLSEREQELLYRLAEEKKIYNILLLNKIYDNMKRGNIK
jgi:restriction endonuclease S subunit